MFSELSIFAVFDGHCGPKAASHLSKTLTSRLDSISDLSNNQSIIDEIVKMDEEFCNTDIGEHGSTIVLAIIEHKSSTKQNFNQNEIPIKFSEQNTIKENKTENDLSQLSESVPISPMRSISMNENTNEMNINDNNNDDNDVEYHIRIFWAGDSRAILVHSSNIEQLKKDIEIQHPDSSYNTH